MFNDPGRFFSLSFSERKGVIALGVIILVITGIRFLLIRRQPDKPDMAITFIHYEKDQPDVQNNTGHSSMYFSNHADGYPPLKVAGPSTYGKKSARYIPVDINTADTLVLQKVYGIGRVLSRRIIRYREILGGYYDLSQISEVYGLPDTLIPAISARFYADTALLRKININTCTPDELAAHPYIGKYTARGIISFRTKSGQIKQLHDLVINGLITPEQFEKIKKYLVI